MDYRLKPYSVILAAVIVCVLSCAQVLAQGPAEFSAKNETATPTPLPDNPPPQSTSFDDSWHFDVAPYVFIPGMHGTLGALGHDASVHVSGSDILSNFNGGLAGLVQARKGRFVMPIDFMWARVATTSNLPLNDLGQTQVRALVSQVIFTPKVGYRLVDSEHLKIDALVGLRYWHEGLTLTPRPANIPYSQSANWVDGLGGAQFLLYFSPKVWITASGDGGAGQASLDYQGLGLINFQPKPLFGFFLGWRYMDVHYSGNDSFIYNVVQSGPMAGLNMQLGGKPPVPPTASCSASPNTVTEGEPVTMTAMGANFDPKHPVNYAWTTNGGKLDATDKESARIDTTGVAAGTYGASATVSDPKVKKGGSATCSASYSVKAKPMNPPQVSCSASPSAVKSGDPSTITASASSPDNAQITGYTYAASAGKVSGAGTTATLDTTGASSGPISITVTATDARNLSGNGACTVSVEVAPAPPTCGKINSIQFPDLKRPWRVDNTAKAILDDVASRLKADPSARIDIVGYADGEKPPMDGAGKNRRPVNLAAQRAVNAKAYLVQQQGIDASRIGVRTGTGQQKVADIVWVPQGADENTCTDLQNTTPVDESTVKPSENAYPKARAAMPAQ